MWVDIAYMDPMGIEYETKQQYKIILVPQSLQTIKQIIICN